MPFLKPSKKSALRAVLDTQVIIRGAVAKGTSLTAKIYDAWRENRFVLLTSEAIWAEINEVLHRPKLQAKLNITLFEATAIVARIRRNAEFVEVVTSIRQCRDPKDDKFLQCAVDGKADYLVSADKDILTLKSIHQIPIISNYETDSLTFHRKGATGRWSTGALEHWGIGALERHLSNDWFFSSSMKKNPKCSLSTFPQRSSAPVRSPRLCGYSERNKTKFIVT